VIVVISHPADVHATRVLERLGSWGQQAFLFDIADLPDQATITIDYADPRSPAVRMTHRVEGQVRLSDATAVWWRRPQFVQLDAITDPDARGFAFGEWHEALHGLFHLLRCPWMNPPLNDDAASRKAHQLLVASEIGWRVPDTLMTSDAGEAIAFIERHGIGRTIYKIFSATHQVWRETRLVAADDLTHLDALRLAPVIFQEYIPAAADIRVTVVGDELFAMAIDSRGTPAGEFVFLEVNPAGEFLFAEADTGWPITDAVAGWLASPTSPPLSAAGVTA
jgi:glutathione synthase/RimK-type ligase-like ATP-grasp enzyme